MLDTEPGAPRAAETEHPAPLAAAAPDAATTDEDSAGLSGLKDDLTHLVEDARTYAAAEIAFQKTRAGLAGRKAGRALVLLNLALVALAVGAVIALAPLVTIWGAIAIVVGVLLAGVVLLVTGAAREGRVLGAMFAPGDET